MGLSKERLHQIGLLWLRVWIGFGMAYHGTGKIFSGRMDQFAGGVGDMGFPLPGFFAWAAVLSEFLGGILIALGLATRPAAGFVAVTMFVAAFIRHGQDPFQKKELALAYLVTAIAILFLGAGKYSLDRLLNRRSAAEQASDRA